MRILLSDGSGLTARQSATLLARRGHSVHVLAPDPLCLCRLTRHVEHVHRVPPYVALGAFEDGGVLAQAPAQGALAMAQGVFARGELIAAHANERVREGANGGACHKRSLRLGAAQHTGKRRTVLRELCDAALGRHSYRGSRES